MGVRVSVERTYAGCTEHNRISFINNQVKSNTRTNQLSDTA